MQLLIATARFVLEYHTEERSLHVLDSGRGEYYGISWDHDGTRFAISRSHVENDKLQTLEDYAASEVGTVSVIGEDKLQF